MACLESKERQDNAKTGRSICINQRGTKNICKYHRPWKNPIGHLSNLEKHIRSKKFGGLKSYNYCMLMQQLLPVGLWGLFKKGFKMAMMRMCKVFRRICAKVYNPTKFESLKSNAAKNMALLEMEFPPSFFGIMTHLSYHLVQELDLCGIVIARWMYPVERYMKTIMGYPRNMAQPEASMAEGYFKEK
jgi:hypothetical protein